LIFGALQVLKSVISRRYGAETCFWRHFILKTISLPRQARDKHRKKLRGKHVSAGLDATNVGDEGGFAPNIQENLEGLDLIVEAIEVRSAERKRSVLAIPDIKKRANLPRQARDKRQGKLTHKGLLRDCVRWVIVAGGWVHRQD